MAKYSPKENSYKEMYLINKFQKDIMETSLQKLKNNKKDTIESLVSSNISNSDEHKGILENKDQKISQPLITVQNDNATAPVNDPEAINLSIENETPNNSTPLDRDNILEKGRTQIHRRMIFLFRHRVSNEFWIQKKERLTR